MNQDNKQTLIPGICAEGLAPTESMAELAAADPPRLRRADRTQVLLRPCALEDLIEEDHLARIVWAVVAGWDLRAFLDTVAARGQTPGRASTDPKILIALWLFAYTRGIGSGRELDRLCEQHDAYRWLAGGVSLNYHTLNDFRVGHEKALDELLTQMLATLTRGGAVQIRRIGQDGMRVRAGAGRGSFKKRQTLEQHLIQAAEHVEAMKQQQDPSISAQVRAARQRAARQRLANIQRAMEELKLIEAAKAAQKEKPSKHQPAKASETDPEARQMRMPGGGTAPGYNVQLAVAVADGGIEKAAGAAAPVRAIIGVDVTNAGSDVHQSTPMRQQVQQRLGQKIQEHLIDGGYIGLEAINEAAAKDGVKVYAPVPKPREKDVDPHQPKKSDSQAVAQWRMRMAEDQAKSIYKHRAATCETANAECRTYRGLGPMLVRGLNKVRCVALWSALAYNLVHFAAALKA
jgi:transposase